MLRRNVVKCSGRDETLPPLLLSRFHCPCHCSSVSNGLLFLYSNYFEISDALYFLKGEMRVFSLLSGSSGKGYHAKVTTMDADLEKIVMEVVSPLLYIFLVVIRPIGLGDIFSTPFAGSSVSGKCGSSVSNSPTKKAFPAGSSWTKRYSFSRQKETRDTDKKTRCPQG